MNGLLTVCHQARRADTLEVICLIMFAPSPYSTTNPLHIVSIEERIHAVELRVNPTSTSRTFTQ